jgi:hypothetical protein
MQERAAQANCASNLKQIGVAVMQYYQDEKYYPASLTFLMPTNAELASSVPNTGATAYVSTLDVAKCTDDDTEGQYRLSYGYFGNAGASLPALTTTPPTDGGQYVWNYWGYRDDGYAYQSPDEAKTARDAIVAPDPKRDLVNDGAAYNHPLASGYDPLLPRNLVKHSLSNRYAPKETVVTHCIFHRIQTARNLNGHTELYYNTTDPTAGQSAKDIVLFLSGDVKTHDVADWKTTGQWQAQKF